jgi:hypothetical protein
MLETFGDNAKRHIDASGQPDDGALFLPHPNLRSPIESSNGKVLSFPCRDGDANIMMIALDPLDATPEQVPKTSSGLPIWTLARSR